QFVAIDGSRVLALAAQHGFAIRDFYQFRSPVRHHKHRISPLNHSNGLPGKTRRLLGHHLKPSLFTTDKFFAALLDAESPRDQSDAVENALNGRSPQGDLSRLQSARASSLHVGGGYGTDIAVHLRDDEIWP